MQNPFIQIIAKESEEFEQRGAFIAGAKRQRQLDEEEINELKQYIFDLEKMIDEVLTEIINDASGRPKVYTYKYNSL